MGGSGETVRLGPAGLCGMLMLLLRRLKAGSPRELFLRPSGMVARGWMVSLTVGRLTGRERETGACLLANTTLPFDEDLGLRPSSTRKANSAVSPEASEYCTVRGMRELPPAETPSSICSSGVAVEAVGERDSSEREQRDRAAEGAEKRALDEDIEVSEGRMEGGKTALATTEGQTDSAEKVSERSER